MADTPRGWHAAAATFIGDVARPLAIIITSSAAAVATVFIASRGEGYEGAALFIGAVYAGLGALYGAKALENVGQAKASATVDVAKAAAGGAS